MSWPVACCGAEGEQQLVDDIVVELQRHGSMEVSLISSQFGQRFNEYVRMSPWSPYAAGKRNDGSFKRWLKECGFDVGDVVYGNKAWVYTPQWETTWEDSWQTTAEKTAHVELSSWGIGDAGVVDIFKKETCNVMQVPRICNGESLHLNCVNLQENSLGDAGVEALVGYLVRNRIRVDILKLYKNSGITSKGASKLAELYAFDCRPPPKEMHLSDCSICEKGAFELLLAIAQRWRTAERKGGKAARAAYVRLDNNPFSMETVQNQLYYFNFNVREGYDPRSRVHRLCQVHELGGGPKLIALPHISVQGVQGSPSHYRSYESYGYGGYGWEEQEEEEYEEELQYDQYVRPSESSFTQPPRDFLSVVEENPVDPPNDVRDLPIQCGCTVQYHDDPNWIGIVVGFDYKGTAVVEWHQGAKKGLRTTSGGKYLRIVEQATGAASSQEVVLPKEQAKPAWDEIQARLFPNAPPSKPSTVPSRPEDVTKDETFKSQEVFPKTSQLGEIPVSRRDAGAGTEGQGQAEQETEANGSSFPSKPSFYQEPRDCRGVPLKKDDKVQYHDDSSWHGDVIGFSAKDNLTVVSWITGGKAGKRTFASGRFLRIVSRQVESTGAIGRGEDSHALGNAEAPLWHGLSGLAPGGSLASGP